MKLRDVTALPNLSSSLNQDKLSYTKTNVTLVTSFGVAETPISKREWTKTTYKFKRKEKGKTIQFQSLFLLASKDVPSFRVSSASFSIPRLFKAAA